MTDPLEKPEGLNWDPAAVELPPVPLLPPGEDAMSMTIAGVLPTLTAPLATSVAALSAKENMFQGKLGAAESAYNNADDSAGQPLGQLAGMLGQVGQLGQQAGKAGEAASGQSGMFGSLMQQLMGAAQGGGGGQSSGGQGAGGQGAGGQGTGGSSGGAAGVAGQGQTPASGQPQDNAVGATEEPPQEPKQEDREELPRAEADDRHGAGPAPVTPPEQPRQNREDDLGRLM